jgi:hypothetical protein
MAREEQHLGRQSAAVTSRQISDSLHMTVFYVVEMSCVLEMSQNLGGKVCLGREMEQESDIREIKYFRHVVKFYVQLDAVAGSHCYSREPEHCINTSCV